MNSSPTIFLAEDDEVDVMLLRRAFASVGLVATLEIAHDGQALVEQLEKLAQARPGRRPNLVILDLKMPRRDGLETLQWLRAHPQLRHVPTMVFSSSAHRADIARAYELGANAFLVKPPSLVERAEVARFLKDWLRLNRVVIADDEGSRG